MLVLHTIFIFPGNLLITFFNRFIWNKEAPFPAWLCTGRTGIGNLNNLSFISRSLTMSVLRKHPWLRSLCRNALRDIYLTHRHKKAADGSRSGFSHKPVAPHGSVCIQGHTEMTRWSQWTDLCSTALRWRGYQDPCRSTCPTWPLQTCKSTQNFFWFVCFVQSLEWNLLCFTILCKKVVWKLHSGGRFRSALCLSAQQSENGC